MRMAKRGQVLILAALTISLAIIATQVYLYQRNERDERQEFSIIDDYVLGVQQGSRHVVVASLINISRGGPVSKLGSNLDRWAALMGRDYQIGRCDLNISKTSQAPYSDGVWINWSTPGAGVSSASVDVALGIGGRGAEVNWTFNVNVTTTLLISGHFSRANDDIKNVTIVVKLLNEGEPALARRITTQYFDQGAWKNPELLPSYRYQHFGNGTYQYSFIDSVQGTTIRVRAEAFDLRDVFVQAEADLTEG